MSLTPGAMTVTQTSATTFSEVPQPPLTTPNLAAELYWGVGATSSPGTGRRAAAKIPNQNMPKGCQLTKAASPGDTVLHVGNSNVSGWNASKAYSAGDVLGTINYISSIDTTIAQPTNSPKISVSGTQTEAAVVSVTILYNGTESTAGYQWSLGGDVQGTGTLSPTLTLNGLTITFPAGNYTKGAVYTIGQYHQSHLSPVRDFTLDGRRPRLSLVRRRLLPPRFVLTSG
jgi:hypothetical protein